MGFRTKLEEEFNDEINELGQMVIGSQDYEKALDGTCKLADRLITIQKQNDEYELRSKEIENAEKARILEEEQTKKRNRIEWAKVIVPTVGAFTMGVISMIWEKTDVLTSSTGKSALRDILSFRVK